MVPQSALRAVAADFCVSVGVVTLDRATGPRLSIPPELQLEVAIAAQEATEMDLNNLLARKLLSRARIAVTCYGKCLTIRSFAPLRRHRHRRARFVKISSAL